MNQLEQELQSLDPVSLMALGRTLKKRNPQDAEVLEFYRAIGTLLLKKGEPLLAFAHIDEGRRTFPDDQRLRQLLGLALARCGATSLAHRVLDKLDTEQLYQAPATSADEIEGREETLGLLGRVYKDLGFESWPADPVTARWHWEKALQHYVAAYSLRMNYWPAINAAAVATMLGRHDMAGHLATETANQCLKRLDLVAAGQAHDDVYWLNATLGESYLIRKKADAELWYHQAAQLGREKRDFGSMGSTLRQIRILATFLDVSPADVNALFPMPRVAVFAGHLVDQPGRSPDRFPESLVPRVQQEIEAWLEREDVQIGFSSAACGSDLLFVEALLKRGGEAHVILPFDTRFFRETSVAIGGEPWIERYERVLDRSIVETVSERPLKFGEVAYDHANQFLHGRAIMHAGLLSTDLLRLAVWDGHTGDGPGGTNDVVFQWSRLTQPIDVIPVPHAQPATTLEELGWDPSRPSAATDDHQANAPPEFGNRVTALLFADVVSFSKLNEDQLPIFVNEFLQSVADLLDRSDVKTIKRNTWGDGLFLVFEDIGAAGRFALDLTESIRSTDWESKGLPANLGLRTALHAGPVYLCTDPITRQLNCIGTHVSHAARIEPITPANEVYASEVFAALAVAEGITDFHCRYVGHMPLAKDHGVHATYHVTRATGV